MSARFICLLYGLLVLLPACREPDSGTRGETPRPDDGIKYARRFAVAHAGPDTWVYLLGNRDNFDTTAVFVLNADTLAEERIEGEVHYMRKPCRSIASLSSIYTQALFELGALDAVTGIDNIDYVTNEAVVARFNAEHMPELAKTPDIDVEQTLLLSPDVVFTYGMGDGAMTDRRLYSVGIPVAVITDHLESSPLARAEWIKFFGEFVDRRKEADSIFAVTEQRYHQLRTIAHTVKERPTVLSEIRYSDAWYMPGGASYVATLLRDAGARYLWEDDTHTGSLPLSFEEVFARARNADFWIHLSMVKTKKELLAFERRYGHFRAFQTGNLYNNTRHTNKKGYSSYWESGMIHPERILSDLITIFHPALSDDTTLYYYEKIQ